MSDEWIEEYDPIPVIIAGSRSITGFDAEVSVSAVMSQITAGGPTRGRYEIISGCANGIDQAGIEWAKRYDCDVAKFDPYNPEDTMTEHSFNEEGKGAFFARNQEMAEYVAPDGMLVAIWDGESNGTRDMIDRALDIGINVFVDVVDPENNG